MGPKAGWENQSATFQSRFHAYCVILLVVVKIPQVLCEHDIGTESCNCLMYYC